MKRNFSLSRIIPKKIYKFLTIAKKYGLMLALKRIYCYLNSLHIYKKQIQIELPKYEYKEKFNNKNDKIKLICFYLPQFHTFPENDNWWGKGFTEWTNVKRSRPMYVNHIQPEIPHSDIGYYIIKDTSTIKQQADLALSFGVYGFCFHYYWFSGKKIMEKVIENFLADQSIDLPFCINWANENWTRRWDGLDDQILIKQDYSVKNLKNFMLQIIPIFKDKRYIRIKDRPLFLVYRSDQIPNIKNVINMWTDLCIQNNENKPFFVMCLTNENYEFANLGFDAAVQFPPHMPWTKYRSDLPNPALSTVLGVNKSFKGRIFSYDDAAQSCIASLENLIFPGVFPSWDNTPRRLEYSKIFAGSSPTKYGKWLEKACEHAIHQENKFVFVNAWNEWGEGAHLEPDVAWGYAWLNQTARILSNFNSKKL